MIYECANDHKFQLTKYELEGKGQYKLTDILPNGISGEEFPISFLPNR